MPQHTPQERRKNRRQQRKPSTPRNPRASGNQASAKRPDSAVQGDDRSMVRKASSNTTDFSNANVDQSRLRPNQRRVEQNVQQQSADRMANLIDRGVGVPESGLNRNRQIGSTGRTGADVREDMADIAEGGQVRTRQEASDPNFDRFASQRAPTQPDLGVIDQSAVDRIMRETGVSEEEARQQVADNRENVQQAFGQVGTGQDPIEEINRREGEAIADLRKRQGEGTAGATTEADVRAQFQNERETAIRQEEAQAAKQASEAQEEAARAGTRQEMEEDVPTPEATGAGAAFANLPEEAQFLAPFLQEFQQSMRQSMEENQQMTQTMLGKQDETFGSIDEQLSAMQEGYKASTEAMQGLLEDARDQNEQQIAKQEKAAKERLEWEGLRERRNITKQKREAHDTMVAQIALAGGFAQDAGVRAVMESDAEYDSKMSELATTMSFARTDLAAKFSGLYMENQNNYTNSTISNMKELRSSLERIGMQGIANQQARQTAEQNLLQSSWDRQVNLRNNLATQNLNVAGQISGMIRQDKIDKINAEDRALSRIDYLLNNYPRESVSEAIEELGKDVTSFDVQSLINNPTFAEIQRAEAKAAKARSSVGGGSYAGAFLPSGMQEEFVPEKTYEEYAHEKVLELEEEQGQSFSPAKRAELIMENAEEWETEYQAVYMAGNQAQQVTQARTSIAQQFGQPVVEAANLVIDGTYGGTNAIKNAAKAFSVPEHQLATAVAKLKMSGEVAETAILSPQAQKSRDKIISNLKSDPFYTVWNGAKSAATRIEVAIGDNGGADGLSDIMAINAFQNGIVDPGATVREGDVALMQTAIAWADLVSLDLWKEKISDGDKLPASMRQKMLQLATNTRDAYGRDFQNETVPKVKSLIEQNGLPSTVLDEYIGDTAQPVTISPKVTDFINSKGY